MNAMDAPPLDRLTAHAFGPLEEADTVRDLPELDTRPDLPGFEAATLEDVEAAEAAGLLLQPELELLPYAFDDDEVTVVMADPYRPRAERSTSISLPEPTDPGRSHRPTRSRLHRQLALGAVAVASLGVTLFAGSAVFATVGLVLWLA